jgi:hypothetical protein|tara:strand:+ start:1388 stop:2035 length:648 start_codon:yes stop_codon:yes gene_type:complete
MAANEHRNLSNDNLHLPLDFSTASNSTVLTKNSDGDLVWESIGDIKPHTITLRGYCSPADANYKFPANMDVNKDLEFTRDYGSTSVQVGFSISVSNMLRSSIFVAPADCIISNVYGWVTGKDATETVTFALCKGSNVTVDEPTEFVVSAATNTLVLLEEFTASTYSSNLKLGAIDDTSFAINSLSKGDFLMPMIKHPSGANDTYFNMSIELKYSV